MRVYCRCVIEIQMLNIKYSKMKKQKLNKPQVQQCNINDVSKQREHLISFLQWYVIDEASRTEPDRITNIVERYLKRN